MRPTRFGVVVIGLAAAVTSCGGSGSSSSGTGGAGGAGGAAGAAGAGGDCNSLPLLGGLVSESVVAGPMPAPAGGTVTDGTYVLTKWEVYSGTPLGQQQELTLKFAAGHAQVAIHLQMGSTGAWASTNFDYSTSGTSLTANTTCPSPNSYSWEYTASATQFLQFAVDPEYSAVYTFTKQ